MDIISDVNLAYSEHARRYLADCGLPKERTYVTGSPMAEVLYVDTNVSSKVVKIVQSYVGVVNKPQLPGHFRLNRFPTKKSG